jgi:hypothetical protein
MSDFPAYKTVSTDSLIPYARNSRTHSDAQVAKIAASIREFGFLNPIIVDGQSGIIAGHGRVLAAQKLGLATLPVIEAGHLTEAQKRAYIIADNRLALDAGWDNDMLKVELSDLDAMGFDLALTGFELGEIADFLAEPTEGLTDPDAVPDVPEVPVTVEGDVWLLGRHRIACGSSTDAHTVEAVLAGVKPHLMVTDPPYGVEYDANWRTGAKNADGSLLSTGSGRAKGKVENDGNADWSEAWALFPGDVAYVWHAGLFAGVVAESLASCGFPLRSQIIWAKEQLRHWARRLPLASRAVLVCRQEGIEGPLRIGDRKQTTLWQIPKPQKSETGHSTQKPIECMKRPNREQQ